MVILNLTNCSNPKLYRGSVNFQQYLVVTLIAIISVLGFILNMAVFVLIVKVKSLKTVPNLLIANLAIADISYLFGHVLTNIPNILLSTFIGGYFLCKLQMFTRYATLGGSIFTLTVMAIDRFTAIVLPLNHQSSYWRSKKFVSVVIISIWLVAILITLPVVYVTEIIQPTIPYNKSCLTTTLCIFRKESVLQAYRAVIWIQFGIYFFFPFIIICICYITIALKLETQENSGTVQICSSRSINKRKKLSKIVLAFIIIFVICRLPDQLNTIIIHISQYSHYFLLVTAQFLTYVHPLLNPLTLLMLSALFRYHLFHLFRSTRYDRSIHSNSYVPKSKMYCIEKKKEKCTTNSDTILNNEEMHSCL